MAASVRFPAAPDGVAGDPPADRWWRAFGDPDLDRLVEGALARNEDLAAAEALIRRGRALTVVAGAARLPAVSGTARVADDKLSRNGENLALIPITPKTTEFTDYRVGVDASWELDLAGRTRREVEAAVARFGSATETRNDARVVIASEVAYTYVDLRVAQARLRAARDRLSEATEIRRLVMLQRRAGVAGDDDVRRADVDVAAESGAVAPLEAQVDSTIFGLAALTGDAAESLRAALSADAAIPSAPRTVPVGLATDLLLRRPDIRRAERELAAATADVGTAVAAQFPRLSLVADAGLDSIRLGDLGAAASRYWNVAPQASVPLFAGGRLRAQVRAAEAARDAAVASYRGTVLRALSDAESAIARYAAARSGAASSDAAAQAMAAQVATAERRRAAGDASLVDVLAARRGANEAIDRQCIANGEFARAYAALNRALGGGWQGSDAQTSASR